MSQNSMKSSLLVGTLALLATVAWGCDNERGGGRPSAQTDASTGDAAWKCEVGSYYECDGPGGCKGAAQCITGGEQLGTCRCLSGPADGGVTTDASTAIDNRICEPGQMYSCSGSGGCAGQAPCEDDGRSLGICECPDGGGVPDAALGNGRCSNANDSVAVGQTYVFGTVEETQSFCQLSCSFEENPSPTCVTDCTYDFTGGAVSRECLSCFDDKTTCEADNLCDIACLISEQDCQDCKCGRIGGVNCEAAFSTCSGLPNNAC